MAEKTETKPKRAAKPKAAAEEASSSNVVIIKGKRPAVVFELADGEFTRIILSTNHAAKLINRLKLTAEPDDGDAQTSGS